MKLTMNAPTKVVLERPTREVTHHIKAWRLKRGFSVEKLGLQAGVSGSMISQLERGKTTYTQATLEKLANVLEVAPWQLLACGPDENRQLWDIVLSRGVNGCRLEDFFEGDRSKIEIMLTNHCDAVIKSAREFFTTRGEALPAPAVL